MSATLADPAPDEGDRWFTPEYLLEVRAAVQREHLAVTNIFGMHYDVTPWTTVVAALDRFLSSPPRSATASPRRHPLPPPAHS